MPTFLILQSPNKGNVGTTTQREEGFYKPTFYRISDSELEQYNLMNAHAKAAFIAEKLEAQIGTPLQDKKKVAPIVEVVESQAESVSVEMPEVEVEEPLNEPINEVVEPIISPSEYIGTWNEKMETVIEKAKSKPKGRPKKTN